MIERTKQGSVDVVRMQHGRANALDLEFLQALREEFERPTAALVLVGTGSIFSAGVDLKRLLAEGDDYADAFLAELDDCFRALFTIDAPVVAAVNGHAIAGGAILAFACDEILAVDGKARLGVPELVVGVPFPAMAMEILRFRAPRSTWTRLVHRGETLPIGEACALGLVDELVETELEGRAVERAAALAGACPRTFVVHKRATRRPAMDNYNAALEHEDELRDVWKSDACRDAIRDYMERTFG